MLQVVLNSKGSHIFLPQKNIKRNIYVICLNCLWNFKHFRYPFERANRFFFLNLVIALMNQMQNFNLILKRFNQNVIKQRIP